MFVLLLVVSLAFIGYRMSFRGFRLPFAAVRVHFTGIEFLFLGLLLGPAFLNVVDEETQRGLAPLTALLLGWVGLLFGFQFEVSKLRRLPFEYLAAANFQVLFTLVSVFLAAYTVLPLVRSMAEGPRLSVSLTLAAVAACTGQSVLSLMVRSRETTRTSLVRLLQTIAGLDGFVALLFFGLAFALRSASMDSSDWLFQIGKDLAVSLSLGLGLTAVFLLLLGKRMTQSELILAAVGLAVLTSGAASVLNLSPLIANFFVGVCMVNLSREKERIYQILTTVEKPVYLLILLFLGVSWKSGSGLWLALGGAYCLVRIMSKVAAGVLIPRLFMGLREISPQLGLGLLDMGGLSLAILLDFSQGFQGPAGTRAVSVVLPAIILTFFLSPYGLNQLLFGKQDEDTGKD